MSDEKPKPMSPNAKDVQAMMRTRGMINQLRDLCDTQSSSPAVDQEICLAIDVLRARLTDDQIRVHLENWRSLNRITSESKIFEQHCQTATAYLEEAQGAQKVPGAHS